MKRSFKIIASFAAVGFLLPPLLLAYYEFSMRYMGGARPGDLLFWICPTAIWSMALDNATVKTAVFVWVMISASNAILYALLGSVVAFLTYIAKLNRS